MVFPHIAADSIVCRLGLGTGVYTRDISKIITGGQFHVVDSDPSAIDFLRRHLPKNQRVAFATIWEEPRPSTPTNG